MSKKEDVFVSAVVYLSDNSENVCSFVDDLILHLEERFQHYEIVVVDDCCKYQVSFLDDYIRKTSNKFLTIIHMSVKQGIEACMRAGIDTAIGDFIYEFDTLEYEFDKDLIWKAYQKAVEGNDVVSVEIVNNSLSRKIFYKLFNKYSLSEYEIYATVFRLVSRRAVNRVLSLNINCEFRLAVYASSGLKNGRLYYSGNASKTKSRGISLAIDSFILYTDLPRRMCLNSLRLVAIFGIVGIILLILNCILINPVIMQILAGITFLCILDSIVCLVILIYYARLILNGAIEGKNYLVEDIQKVQR